MTTDAPIRSAAPGFALAAALSAVLAASACSKPDGNAIPGEDREYLENWASRLAPSMVLPDVCAPAPDTAGISELIALCDANPDYYLYFYGCLKDSISSVTPPDPGCLTDSVPEIRIPDSLTNRAGSP
ncbi:MAG: hypothetical protein QUS11_11945 [Candidatus Fermentibacter sp.]|nr:hypothetical protein [Candidatus Fermentibacter sp.]